MKSYTVLRADRAADEDVKVGDIVYAIRGHDYGLAHDDEAMNGIPYKSVTFNKDGDYPSFTIPEVDLREVGVLCDSVELPEGVDAIIRQARLIDIGEDRVAQGFIYQDRKLRFPDGMFVRRTSTILEGPDEQGIIKTKNSTYKVELAT
jgi:hypothetical protein